MSFSDSETQSMRDLNGCAEAGDVGGLWRIIGREPSILRQIEEVEFIRTPMHAAAERGQKAFALRVMGLKPSLGRKLDKKGLSPLHVALERGEKETVLAMVRKDSSLVRVKGDGDFTPLHYAARYYPDLDVLAEFLIRCQGSIDDLTDDFKTAVHLVVESKDAPAIDMVLKWIVRTAREPVLRKKDDKMDTALHLAARLGCEEAVRLLVKITKINKINSENKTPLDEAIDSGNDRMVAILERARAKRARDISSSRPKVSSAAYLSSGFNFMETWVRGYCMMVKELTNEMRSIVLIVAVLITTATYQAVLQPPGGVFPGPDDSGSLDNNVAPAGSLMSSSKAGKMVMEELDYNLFMPANTVAFMLSTVTIIFVLHGRAYNVILHMCLVFVAYSYLTAMLSISDNDSIASIMYILSWGVLSTAFGLKMAYYGLKALFTDVWWVPTCGVMWHKLAYLANGRAVCGRIMEFARKLRRQGKLMINKQG